MATPIIATAIVICNALSGTASNSHAPKPEPMIVRKIEGSKRLRLRTPFPMKGKEPPTLMKVKASMLVAIATWASMPQSNHDGNGDERCAASHDADDARDKEDYD